MTPHDFLNLLWQHKPEEMYVLLWTLQDKRSHWFRDVGKAARLRSERQRPRRLRWRRPFPRGPRPPASLPIGGNRGHFRHGLRSGPEVGGACEAVARHNSRSTHGFASVACRHTIVIATGNGAHPGGSLRNLHLRYATRSARTPRAWWPDGTLLRLNAAARGWAFDRLSDLARVLRVPGTAITRIRRTRRMLSSIPRGRRYNLSDFAEFLDDAAIPDPEAQEKAAREWAERFADTPLVIDIDARIPQEMLDGWMAADMRFKNTWHRQRHDLKDQSQSGLRPGSRGFRHRRRAAGTADRRPYHPPPQPVLAEASADPRGLLPADHRDMAGAPVGMAGIRRPCRSAPRPRTARCATGRTRRAGRRRSRDTPTPDPTVAKGAPVRQISQALGIRVCRAGEAHREGTHVPHGTGGGKRSSLPTSASSSRRTPCGWPSRRRWGRSSGRSNPSSGNRSRRPCSTPASSTQGGEEMEWEGAARMYVAQYLSETGFIDTHRRPAGAEPAEAHGHRRQDRNLRQRPADLHQQTDVPDPVRQGGRRSMLEALGGKSIRVRGSELQGAKPVDACRSNEFDPRGLLAGQGRTTMHRLSSNATGTLEEIGQRDHALTSEYRIFGPPGTGKTTNLTRQIQRAVDRYGRGLGPGHVLLTRRRRRTRRPRSAHCPRPRRHVAFALLARAWRAGDRGVARGRMEPGQSRPRHHAGEEAGQARRRGSGEEDDSTRPRTGDELLQQLEPLSRHDDARTNLAGDARRIREDDGRSTSGKMACSISRI